MDIISAYREVGTFRGAAVISGTTHKTVRRVMARHQAGAVAARVPPARNYDAVAELVAGRVKATAGRISAKRLLPAAQAAGYAGSARSFRRLVADCKQAWRADHHRGRRPAVWSPGEHLVIDWGAAGGLHVVAWSPRRPSAPAHPRLHSQLGEWARYSFFTRTAGSRQLSEDDHGRQISRPAWWPLLRDSS